MAGGYQNGNSDLSSWQDDYGLTGQRAPSPYDSISSLTGLAPPKQVVSRQPVGPGSGYSLVTHNDGSTEYQDANGNPVPPSYARYSVPASTVGQSSTGTVNRPQGGPSVPSGNYGGPQSGASTVGSGQTVSSIASSGRSPRASDLPSVDNLLRLKETVQAPIGQSGLPGRSIAAASTGVAAGNGGNPSGAHPSGLGGPRFHGISFDPELRAVVPVEQSGPKVVSERPYSSNSKEQVYDNSTRKIFWNNHKLAAIGKSIPSVDRTQQGYQYIPAAGFEHVQNPLWGTPGTDLYRDAAQFKGVRKLIYDPGTHLTTALFYDPRPGAVYYSGGNHTRGPAEGGGISTAHTYYEGGKRALSEAGNDIVRGAPILGQKIKKAGIATANTIQGLVNNSAGYTEARVREGLGWNNNDVNQIDRAKADQQMYLSNLSSIVDILTPGTFKDLATSYGYYKGGDKRAAMRTLKTIGLNYNKELHEHPFQFGMNAAAVILPSAKLALSAAADMDRIAVAYDALGDEQMANRAREWEEVYRDRAESPDGVASQKNMLGRGSKSFRQKTGSGATSKQTGPAGPQQRPGGILLRREGKYWVKSVDPSKHPLVQAYAGKTIRNTAAALDKLGDMAAPHYMKGDELWVQDVGKYPYPAYSPEFMGRYIEGMKRLGTPFNDIKPRNMGANGEIFDPDLPPYSVETGTLAVGGALYGGYRSTSGR